MGYYTDFTVTATTLAPECYHEQLEELSDYEFESDGSSLHLNAKWYSDDKDMRKLSLMWPGVLFIVEGTGEEQGDIWRQYFKDGKAQYCEAIITFDEFNEEKLK